MRNKSDSEVTAKPCCYSSIIIFQCTALTKRLLANTMNSDTARRC